MGPAFWGGAGRLALGAEGGVAGDVDFGADSTKWSTFARAVGGARCGFGTAGNDDGISDAAG